MKYQLNSKTTTKVIRIRVITDVIIGYSIFENSYFADNNINGENKNISLQINKQLSIPLINENFEENENYLALQSLLTLIEFSDYEISNDLKNWHIQTMQNEQGQSLPCTLRIFIPNTLILESIQKTNAFTPLYNKMAALVANYSIISKQYTCVYYSGVKDMNVDDITIIQSYPEIIIDMQ